MLESDLFNRYHDDIVLVNILLFDVAEYIQDNKI